MTDLPAQDYKIDVLWLAREAIRMFLDHWRLAVALGWAPLALVFAAELVAAALGGRTLAGLLLMGLVRGLGMIAFGRSSSCAGTGSCCATRRARARCSRRPGGCSWPPP